MFEKYITSKFLRQLDNIKFESLSITTPDDKKHQFIGKDNELNPQVHIKNWNVIPNFIAKGDIGLAESYRDGHWDCNNLTELLIVALKNNFILDKYLYGSFISKLTSKIFYLLQSNTIKGSKRNINAHYDLGNDFYSLWLDETMTYSSALFHNKNDSLKQAQHNKYDRILQNLNSNSGNILEIGCGWGGFAERALENYDFDLKGITISNKQYEFATKRLTNKAKIAFEDYRKQHGKYDNIVSIEMFEAVGEKYWPVYFSKIKQLLENKGRAIIQTITIDDSYFERYKKSGDMIRSFIFPGGMLPSISRLSDEIKKAGLRIVDNFNFDNHNYALTLKHWLNSFENNLVNIKKLGFDEKFIRIWRFYLAACIAGFSSERTSVIQTTIEHA